jgi:hypothetical protein
MGALVFLNKTIFLYNIKFEKPNEIIALKKLRPTTESFRHTQINHRASTVCHYVAFYCEF